MAPGYAVKENVTSGALQMAKSSSFFSLLAVCFENEPQLAIIMAN